MWIYLYSGIVGLIIYNAWQVDYGKEAKRNKASRKKVRELEQRIVELELKLKNRDNE